MFSATMKDKIEKLTVNILNYPIKVICGDVGEANTDVEQTVIVLPADVQAKFEWLYSRILQFITMGKVLIFVTKKLDAEIVAKKLKLRDIDLGFDVWTKICNKIICLSSSSWRHAST